MTIYKDSRSCGSLTTPFLLPPRPEVLVELAGMLTDPETDLGKVCLLIKQDVALYTAVMATINSAAFSRGQRINSLEHAVSMLGLKRTFNIVRLSALKNSLSPDNSLDRFWDTATEVAQLTAFLAASFNQIDNDDAYSLGMLHDCGIPLMLSHDPAFKSFLHQVNALPTLEIEQRQLAQYGISHFQAGALLASEWGFSQTLVDIISAQPHFQHVLQEPIDDREAMRFGLSLLVLARDISNAYRRFWRLQDHQSEVAELRPALEFLGISDLDYLDLKEDCIPFLEQRQGRLT